MRTDTASPCIRCGSSKVVPAARVVERLEGGVQSPYGVQVRVDRRPDALLSKQAELSELRARVCGECGTVDFYAVDAYALYSAYLESLGETE